MIKITFKGSCKSCNLVSYFVGPNDAKGYATIFVDENKVNYLGNPNGRVFYKVYNNEVYLGHVGSGQGWFFVSSSEYQKATFTAVDPPTGDYIESSCINFGCDTLADLASALGGIMHVKSQVISVTANTPYEIGKAPLMFYICKETGSQSLSALYVVQYSYVTQLAPTSGEDGLVVSVNSGTVKVTYGANDNLLIIKIGRMV